MAEQGGVAYVQWLLLRARRWYTPLRGERRGHEDPGKRVI